MRCLTVRQPWAWAIFNAGKDVENRTRNIIGSHRGETAIHSSGRKSDDPQYIAQALEHRIFAMLDAQLLANLRAGWGLLYGCVLGAVDVRDVHQFPSCLDADGAHCSWWADQVDGMHHIEIEDPRPLRTPLQIPGHLGLWDLPDQLLNGRWL